MPLRDFRAQGPRRAARGAFCNPCSFTRMLHGCSPPPPTRGQVRCCSEVKLSPAWGSRRSGCSVWGESNAGWPCTRDKTFAEAEAICQAAGARLCTRDELVSGCTAGTGCGFDFELNWATAP